MKDSGVVCHGDCDGVISAYLYVKHYLRDSWPNHIMLVFTQPWRAHLDARKIEKELREGVFLDLAINEELAEFIRKLSAKAERLIIIDHHKSSGELIKELSSIPNVKTVWRKAPSCPRLMINDLKLAVNPYEKFLVDVADICEGGEARNSEAAKVADLIKLSIARDPGDINYMTYLVKVMLEGRELHTDPEVTERAKIAKFLLHRLLKLMGERSLEVGSMKVITLSLPESRIYAGLLGIAATEFARITHKDVALIRREEGKVVVTIRTLDDKAYRICEELARRTEGKFGGHAEAASATLQDMELDKAVELVSEVIRYVSRKQHPKRMR